MPLLSRMVRIKDLYLTAAEYASIWKFSGRLLPTAFGTVLNDGTTSSREMLELSIGRKRPVAFQKLAIVVVASSWVCKLYIEVLQIHAEKVNGILGRKSSTILRQLAGQGSITSADSPQLVH